MRIKLSFPLLPSEIAAATGGICKGIDTDVREIHYISTDSREVCENDLYIDLGGENYPEGEFITEAKNRGAVILTSLQTERAILVRNTRSALLDLAGYYKTKLKELKYTVGITGSVGKSTVKEFLKVILSKHYVTHATEKNYNNGIGVPLTILSAPENCEALAVELGSNHYGEIKVLSECLKPDIAIITNIGSAHIGNFGSRRRIAEEKSEIIAGMENGVLLAEYGETLIEDFNFKKTVSSDCPRADFFLLPVAESIGGTTFDLFCQDRIIKNLEFKIGGRHFLNSLGYAVAAGVIAGLGEDELRLGVSEIKENATRRRFIKVKDFIIFDDSYNSSPESVCADLNLMKMYKGIPKGALIGDILELGSESERIHRELGEILARSEIDRLYLFGVYSHFVKEGALSLGMNEENILANSDTTKPEITVNDIIKNHEEGELILCKASRKIALERIIESLTRGEKNDRP